MHTATFAPPDTRRAAGVLLLPITHPLTRASLAHAALAGLFVWLLLLAGPTAPGADAALACATPFALLVVLAASACPLQSPRCHARRLLGATALLPVLLLAWAVSQPLDLAPVVMALATLFLAACHAAAWGAFTFRAAHRAAAAGLARASL